MLLDGAADGAWNMAADEAILDRCVRSESSPLPTLRLYDWSAPTLSLGRGQRAPGARGLAYLAEQGVRVVRRPSGGGAVLHGNGRTYAVIARLGEPPFAGGVLRTYAAVSRALARALRRLGAEVRTAPQRASGSAAFAACFDIASPYELTWKGKKLIGSAQLRRRRAFLQHGSIPARPRADLIATAFDERVRSERHGGLEEALGRPFDQPALDHALVAAFEELFDIELVVAGLETEEIERATRLRALKYLSTRWTLEGRP